MRGGSIPFTISTYLTGIIEYYIESMRFDFYVLDFYVSSSNVIDVTLDLGVHVMHKTRARIAKVDVPDPKGGEKEFACSIVIRKLVASWLETRKTLKFHSEAIDQQYNHQLIGDFYSEEDPKTYLSHYILTKGAGRPILSTSRSRRWSKDELARIMTLERG